MSTQQLWDAGMPQQWQHCEGRLPLCAAPNTAMEVVTLQEPLFSWTALFFLHFELLVTYNVLFLYFYGFIELQSFMQAVTKQNLIKN